MIRFVSLARFRRSATLRLMAIWVLALAISPFTPPFATCDIGTLAGNTPIHVDAVSADKKIQEELATDLSASSTTPGIIRIVLSRDVPPARADVLRTPRLVLRI